MLVFYIPYVERMCIMKLSDFLERNLTNSTKANELVSDFIKELQNHLENSELNIEDGSKFVVTDINDNIAILKKYKVFLLFMLNLNI